MSPLEILKKSNAQAEIFVMGIQDDQWELPTNTDWNVKDLLNHSLSLNYYTPQLLAGESISEWDKDFVGDKDPKESWKEETTKAFNALSQDGALDKITHLPFGDMPGVVVANILASENLIHAWDLAHATAQDDTIDKDLIEHFYSFYEPQQQMLRESGNFGKEAVNVAEDVDMQTKLLALLGRKR